MLKTEQSLPSNPLSIAICTSVILVLVLLASCGSHSSNDDPAKSTEVPVVKVERKNITRTLQIASEFLPYQEIDIYAKVSGYIQKLNINWGSHVKEGQLMAVLEVPELEQQLREDEAALGRSENELARAQQEQARVESDYTVAHVTYTRLEGVWKSQPGIISREDLDVAQGKDSEAKASVSAAKAALHAQEQGLAAARATLGRDQAMFSYARIVAPFDGVVTRLNAYTGALLPAGTSRSQGDLSLCRLSQNDLLRLVIPVPERSVPSVHIGDSVAVEVSTIGKTFQGKVVRFSDQIDLTTRTMHTEIDVPNSKYILVPGMYASVKLPVQTVGQALVIPVQAVQSSGETRGSVMVVSNGNTLKREDVVLGLRTSTDVQVTSGLQENETVIFGEQSQYKPGDHVTPKVVQPPSAD
ncbi:MAG TPA: efflux RND transporter periplasmic adaptor subunit [Candidatus Sulfotelmatobacter sp.]|nr:efflux RND transporter periplasmic adaptor subunit [Candidatus Sulfotelmatobacter sp.]